MNKNNLLLLEDWLSILRINKKRQNTISAYKRDIVSFLEYVGMAELKDVRVGTIESWISSLKGKDGEIKMSTRNRKVAALKKFYSYLYKKGIEDITEDIEFYDIVDGDKKNILTDAEVKMIEKTLHKNAVNPETPKGCVVANAKMNALRDRAMYILMLHSGMRVGEIVNLELDEIIKHDDGTVEVFIPIDKDKSKRGRLVQIDPKIIEYIEQYRKSISFKPNNNYVFLSQTGRILTNSNVDKRLKMYAEMAGIDKHISNHCTRHSYATRMLANKEMDSVELAQVLGHADTKMIQRVYGHRTEKTRRKFSKIS